MRHLIAVRHAKSSWADQTLTDHDRPLNARGRRAAPMVAAALREAGYVPELAYSSTSARTRESWHLMAPVFGAGAKAHFHEKLYLASSRTILEVIASAPPHVRTLMTLGHNPGVLQLALELCRRGDPAEVRALRGGMPTGAAVVVALDGEGWRDAARGGELVKLILPRRLEDS